MASTSPIDDSAFKQALDKFRSKISAQHAQDFQFTTIDDLRIAIAKLQREQMSERRMRNLKRLENFVLKMGQFEQIVAVYLNASAFGPVKFLLLVASSYSTALDAMLGMYDTIGLNLPQLEQYQSMFQTNPHMREILHLIYADILRFHHKTLKFFKLSRWKVFFEATWDSSKVKLSHIVESFRSHRALLESQASLIQFEEYRRFVLDNQEKDRQYKQDEDHRKRIAVRDWLNAANATEDQESYRLERARHPQTGKWILQDSRVRAWCDSSTPSIPMLWLTGKTILASVMIEELEKLSTTIIFFYCKHGDQMRNSFLSIARGLLGQLVTLNKPLLPHFYECAAGSATDSHLSISRAQELLSLALSSLPSVYIVIDGIDECPPEESRMIIPWFQKEIESINSGSADARCLLISQDDHICQKLLKDTPTLRVSKDNNMSDIRVYCDTLSESWVDKFNISDPRRREVVESIVNNASGMFLFARLVIYNLNNQVSRADFNQETSSEILPKGLDEAYDRIISRTVSGNDPKARYAKKLLAWIVCAKRSLKWHEIQGAISIDLDTRQIDFENRKLLVNSKELCGSLVEIRPSGAIELVHTTAKSYLLKHKHVVESDEAYGLCRLCLGYLNHPCVDYRLCDDRLRDYVLGGYYAFFDYAIAHWVDHLEDYMRRIQSYSSESFDILGAELEQFLNNHASDDLEYPVSNKTRIFLRQFQSRLYHKRLAQAFEYWKSETTVSSDGGRESHVLDLNRAVQTIRTAIETHAVQQQSLALFYGENIFKCNQLYCMFFVKGFSDSIQRDKHIQEHERLFLCQSPSCPSSQLGFANQSDLVSHEAKCHQYSSDCPEFPVYEHPTTIDVEHACETGNLAKVERWAQQFEQHELDSCPSVWGMRKQGLQKCAGPAVLNAIRNDHFAIVKFFLDKSLNAGQCIVAVIHKAYFEKKYSLLKLILQLSHIKPDTSVEAKNSLFHSVRVLLKRGDDSIARDLIEYLSYHGFALGPDLIPFAAKRNCTTSLEWMFDNLKDHRHFEKHADNVMSTAATYGSRDICRFLLNRGHWDPSTAFKTAQFQDAAANGHDDIFLMILQYSPSSEDCQRWFRISQLSTAARRGDAESIKRLLMDKDLPLDLRDRVRNTPLHYAVMCGHLDVVSLLVNSGRDININSRIGKDLGGLHIHHASPIAMAAFFGRFSITKCLLQRGGIHIENTAVCVIGKKQEYLTPLQIAEAKNHHEIADAIREYESKQKGVRVDLDETVTDDPAAIKEYESKQKGVRIDLDETVTDDPAYQESLSAVHWLLDLASSSTETPPVTSQPEDETTS
ncbi:hypothetical protein BJX99DRAFT_259710 [Aspergillus californicus]